MAASSSSSSQPQATAMAASPSSSSSSQPQATDNNSNLSQYLPLYKAALRGDRKMVSILLSSRERFLTRITENEETALHIAVGTGKSNNYVEDLVGLMSVRELEEQNKDGNTALTIAAMVGNIKAAKILVKKAPDLVMIKNNDGRIPLLEAARYGQKDMVLYLFQFDLGVTFESMTPHDADNYGAFFLLDLLITAGFYDVVLDLIKPIPDFLMVRRHGDESILSAIAGQPSSFPSGARLKFWQRIIYLLVPGKLNNFLNMFNHGDVENPADVSVPPSTMVSLIYKLPWIYVKVISWTFAVCMKVIDKSASPLKRIRDTKLMHRQTLELVKRVCEVLARQDHSIASSLLKRPLLLAAKSGIHEVVEEIVETFPHAIWFSDEENHNIFHLAVMNRREKVFNLLYQMTAYKHLVTVPQDTSGSNILHLAGKLAPAHQLNHESGAALQMQRELQWFQAASDFDNAFQAYIVAHIHQKEVEKFVQPAYKEDKNSEGKTPAMIFTEEHQYLVKEGEKWMKDTANSCIFVAALMATVGFAAAITVPGGNNQDSGIPIFAKERAFVIFGFADALSLFSSTASVLMFLSILTSRYAEADFLYALPKRLIIGLVTLFLSIIFMMVAFGTSLYLVFGDRRQWVLTSVASLACVPVTLFGSLQFSLLVEIIMSTYGPSIFHKQSKRILY